MNKKNNILVKDARKQLEVARLKVGEDIYRRLSAKFAKISKLPAPKGAGVINSI